MAKIDYRERARERSKNRRNKRKDSKKPLSNKVNPGGKGLPNTRLSDSKENREEALKIRRGLTTAFNKAKDFIGDTIGSINEKSAEAKERRKKEGIGEYSTREGNTYKANPTTPGSKGMPSVTPDKSKTTKTPVDTGGTSASDKKAWLEKTRNSPAAKSKAFTKKERWDLQKNKRLKTASKDAAKQTAKLKEAARLKKLADEAKRLQTLKGLKIGR